LSCVRLYILQFIYLKLSYIDQYWPIHRYLAGKHISHLLYSCPFRVLCISAEACIIPTKSTFLISTNIKWCFN